MASPVDLQPAAGDGGGWCSCPCHRSAAVRESSGAWAPVSTIDVVEAVLACARCAGVHCPALAVDHDALAAREARRRAELEQPPPASFCDENGG